MLIYHIIIVKKSRPGSAEDFEMAGAQKRIETKVSYRDFERQKA